MSKRMLAVAFVLSLVVAGGSAGVVVSDADQSPESVAPTVPGYQPAHEDGDRLGQNDTRNHDGLSGSPACPFQ
ncbi:hypothetical protein [Haloarchaeobius sp. DT45]|uniref:hypothetical protein n=1 Tax=Haloarchaeobius sp. DT45 TaxID=3446116 RepID=UPI003F6D98D6